MADANPTSPTVSDKGLIHCLGKPLPPSLPRRKRKKPSHGHGPRKGFLASFSSLFFAADSMEAETAAEPTEEDVRAAWSCPNAPVLKNHGFLQSRQLHRAREVVANCHVDSLFLNCDTADEESLLWLLRTLIQHSYPNCSADEEEVAVFCFERLTDLAVRARHSIVNEVSPVRKQKRIQGSPSTNETSLTDQQLSEGVRSERPEEADDSSSSLPPIYRGVRTPWELVMKHLHAIFATVQPSSGPVDLNSVATVLVERALVNLVRLTSCMPHKREITGELLCKFVYRRLSTAKV